MLTVGGCWRGRTSTRSLSPADVQTMVELGNMGRFRRESVCEAACEGDRSPCATTRERCSL
jgi:hypothetical protein